METVDIKNVILDVRQERFVLVDFFQNDTNIIKFTVSENGVISNLANVDEILVNYKRPDGEIISRLLEAESNVIYYQLGQAEMMVTGQGKLVLQFFRSDNRLSTFTINVTIKKSIEANFEFEEAENGLVNQLFERMNAFNERLENLVIEGGGAPSNVILFEDWTPGESVIIGDTPTPPVDTTPPILTITQGENFTGTKSVTMSVNEAAVIYYTLDGSTPTVNSLVYTSPLTINATTTLKAFARDTAGNSSAIQTIIYTLVVPEPGDTTPPNNVTNLQVSNNTTGTSLTLTWVASTSNDVAGYEIYRGSTLLATVTGNSYNATGLTVNTEYTFTVKAKDTSNNVASGTSITVTAIYVDNVAPVLTITAGATFTDTQTVTMTTNEAAMIYYTIDGTEPTESSLVYSTPLNLTDTTTVKAFAKDVAGNSSVVQTAIFTKVEEQEYVTDGLEIHYDFTQLTETPSSAVDISGNGNNGTLHGYSNTPNSGISNGELVGDGVGDYIVIPRTESLKTYPFTIEFYMRSTYTNEADRKPDQIRFFDTQYDPNGTGSGVNAFVTTDAHLANPGLHNTIAISGSLGSPPLYSVPYNVWANEYNHIVIVWESNRQRIYVNGVLLGTSSGISVAMNTSTRSIYLSTTGSSPNNSLKGALKVFRYYTKALSVEEITQNYNSVI